MDKKNKGPEQRYPRVYIVFDYLWKMLVLNLFFVIFSLVGFVVLGVGPAIAAGHRLAHDWSKKEYPPTFKTYTSYFFKNFWINNIVFYLFLLTLFGVGFNFLYFYMNLEPSVIRLSGLILNFLIFTYIWNAFTYIYIFKHGYGLSWKESLNFSFRYIWGFPLQLFLVLFLHILIFVFSYLMPQIFLFIVVGGIIVSTRITTYALDQKFKLIQDEGDQ